MNGEQATDRIVLAISGADKVKFLQGLVTNDVEQKELTYAALLTPQGKYLADFFLLPQNNHILLDVKETIAEALKIRLNMYKLRADVVITQTELCVLRGLGAKPEGAFDDPRSAELGWRAYSDNPGQTPLIDWNAIRVANRIPETGIELIVNDSYILENCFEDLSGVDFKKGCYVGQEIVARMKHKTELRKGLTIVAIDGTAPNGTEILSAGRAIGTLFTQSEGKALAHLRFDKAQGTMTAGHAKITFPHGLSEN